MVADAARPSLTLALIQAQCPWHVYAMRGNAGSEVRVKLPEGKFVDVRKRGCQPWHAYLMPQVLDAVFASSDIGIDTLVKTDTV